MGRVTGHSGALNALNLSSLKRDEGHLIEYFHPKKYPCCVILTFNILIIKRVNDPDRIILWIVDDTRAKKE